MKSDRLKRTLFLRDLYKTEETLETAEISDETDDNSVGAFAFSKSL